MCTMIQRRLNGLPVRSLSPVDNVSSRVDLGDHRPTVLARRNVELEQFGRVVVDG